MASGFRVLQLNKRTLQSSHTSRHQHNTITFSLFLFSMYCAYFLCCFLFALSFSSLCPLHIFTSTVDVSAYLIYLHIYPSTYLPTYLSIHPPIYQLLCLYFRASKAPSVPASGAEQFLVISADDFRDTFIRQGHGLHWCHSTLQKEKVRAV